MYSTSQRVFYGPYTPLVAHLEHLPWFAVFAASQSKSNQTPTWFCRHQELSYLKTIGLLKERIRQPLQLLLLHGLAAQASRFESLRKQNSRRQLHN